MPMKTVVTVAMRRENGWYIATSPDLKGLIVCHQSHAKFAQEIPLCIKVLFKANHGIDVEVEELPSMENDDVSQIVFEAVKKVA